MPFKILYVSATRTEAGILEKIPGISPLGAGYGLGDLEIVPLITGIGSAATAWSVKNWIDLHGKPDIAINGGIAGSYRDDFPNGEVVMPVTDCFADSGIEDGEKFLTLSEAGLLDANQYPYSNGEINADAVYLNKLRGIIKTARAITVNTSSGSASTIKKIIEKYNPDIETMEGATFFYLCSLENIPFLALRSISNRVEPRNKKNWNIPLALNSLTKKLNEVLLTL
jgi:futalosine hydrolase